VCPAVAPSLIADRYRRTSLIATGGMGEIWRGIDEVLGRDVAIKLLRSEYADNDEFRERFRAEARAVAAVSHPAVVAIYDYGEQEDESGRCLSYLVMEYVDGESLADRLSTLRTLQPEAVAALLSDAAIALDAAHQSGLVHRDVKPANLLLPTAGGVKIVDFGIASAADSVSLTRTGTVIGTAMYMSPEQAGGLRATGASDLYSLGAVAYAALAGRPPFQREAEVAVAMAHISDPPDPLPDTVPPELSALVMSLLAKDPGERPTADQVAARATAIRERPQATTSELPQPTKILPTPVVVADDVDEVAPEVTGVESRRRWIIAAAVAAVVMFVGFAIGLSNGLSAPKRAAGATASHHKAHTKPTPTGVTVKQASFIGLPAASAVDLLRAMGMRPTRVYTPSSSPIGSVIAVSPHGLVPQGTSVKVVIAAPEPKPKPPPKAPPGQAKKHDQGPGHGDHGDHGD
jgi:serine/threonine-protein kinase